MENQDQTSQLIAAPVGKLMGAYSVPCVISLLVAALYNIVDQIFIANAAYLGSNGNAANTVVFPLTVVALAVAVMIGDGCGAFVSRCLGAGETENAHRSVGSAVTLTVICAAVLTGAYFLFCDGLLTALGGRVNEQTFAFSKEYFLVIAAGMPFYMFGQAVNPIIRSDGSPRFAMAATLLGAVLNLILDPVMIYGLHWGMTGAAAATVIGQIATAVLSAAYLCRMKSMRLQRADFAPSAKLICRFIPLGICSFLSQISLVAAMAAINNMVRIYGARDEIFSQAQYAQIPMAVIGIVMKFFQIVISIVVGMSAGCIPIVAYNMGAERRDRAREVLTRLLTAEALVGAAALLIAELLPRQLIAVFGASGESAYYAFFAVRSFRVYLCMLIPACVNKAAFIFLQAMGKPWESTLLSMLREIVFGVGLALLLPLSFGLSGVLYSMPLSDILTFAATIIVVRRAYRELGGKKTVAPPPTAVV